MARLHHASQEFSDVIDRAAGKAPSVEGPGKEEIGVGTFCFARACGRRPSMGGPKSATVRPWTGRQREGRRRSQSHEHRR